MTLTGEKPKYSEKNLFQCQCVHHKSDVDFVGLKPGQRVERTVAWPALALCKCGLSEEWLLRIAENISFCDLYKEVVELGSACGW
jgi:hypothetical protein